MRRDKQIEREINKIYMKVYRQVFNTRNVSLLANGSRLSIEQSLVKLQGSKKYQEFAEKFSKELAKKGLNRQRGVWRKYYEAARKAHYISLPPTYKEYEYNNFRKAIEHNKEMISTIPARMMEILNHKYTETLLSEVAKGSLPRGSFRKMLEEHGTKQAKVIARTETAKLQTAITQNRAEELGAKGYIWRSSNDKRTRPSHREMNDVIVLWREDLQKPLRDNMRGNAGEFPNCRCDPQPIVDFNDLTKSTYKVYDYRIDKIVSMGKNQVIEALEKGRLGE